MFAPVVDWDARIKILLALVFGLLTWRTGWPGLSVYAVVVGYLASTLSGFLAANKRAARAFILFALIWTVVKFGLNIWSGVESVQALRASLLLGARLMVVLLIGLTLAQSTSTRGLGLALAWMLRPILGNRAWKAALALALMIHFLPLAWFAADGVSMGIKTRGIAGRKKLLVYPTALLSRLANKTWSQTVAVAARGLDRPEAWLAEFHTPAAAWVAGFIASAAGFAVSYL